MDAQTVNILPGSGFLCRNLQMLNVNVQTVLSTASDRVPSAHLYVVYHEGWFMAIERAKLAAQIRGVEPGAPSCGWVIAPPGAIDAPLKRVVSARRFL